MRAAVASFGLLTLATIATADDLPLNPAVTQKTIGETICMPGWTKTRVLL